MPVALHILEECRDQWQAQWETALSAWSRFTRLASPRWCMSAADEEKEHLTGSFAMIRLVDHAVVISVRQVRELHLEKFGVEIMAHEIGHHVYAPADLGDNARLQASIRRGLPTRESYTGMIANLYTDLLINDRLQRSAQLDMSGVYRALRQKGGSEPLWALYMRIYEVLWGLRSGSLVDARKDEKLEMDAGLGARVIRAYSTNWLGGAGRFAALLLPYLLDVPAGNKVLVRIPWIDTDKAGVGDVIPDGLAEVGEDESEGAIHPADDPALNGLGEGERADTDPGQQGRATKGGIKNNYRSPGQYKELMAGIGVVVPESELVARYYRERALPYLVRFPVKDAREASDPLPEGIDIWDAGMPVQEIDWIETLSQGPTPLPGVTTMRRIYGDSEGSSPERIPMDLYIGIDCSGSMNNPAETLSYPVLAATVITISALRAGARVMVCLSGEPGRFSQTDGFLRNEREIMKILTGYLGTGYSFGIARLEETFIKGFKAERPTHILVVSDSDIFYMLNQLKNGWDIARDAVKIARGGGTFVLELRDRTKETGRMEELGWNVATVNDQEELVAFAREFSRINYEHNGSTPGRHPGKAGKTQV